VYNVAFRTHQQEKSHLNFWSDQAQAALTEGDVTEFSLPVAWDQLADRLSPVSRTVLRRETGCD